MEPELPLFWTAKAVGGFKTPKKRTHKLRYMQFFSRFVFLCSSGLLDGFWHCFFGPLTWQDLSKGWKWILSILELNGNSLPRNRSLRFFVKNFPGDSIKPLEIVVFCCDVKTPGLLTASQWPVVSKVTLMYHKYPIQLSAPWRQQVAIDH